MKVWLSPAAKVTQWFSERLILWRAWHEATSQWMKSRSSSEILETTKNGIGSVASSGGLKRAG